MKRRSFLAVLVLPNEAAAFQAYRLLQHYGISPEHLAIVGRGYSSPERVGLLEPRSIAIRTARQLSILGGCLGSAIGLVLMVVSHLLWGSPITLGVVLVVPIVAAIGSVCGALGGITIGFLGEGSISGIYRHHLRQGRYLLMIEGSEKLVRWGQEVLSQFAVSSNSRR